MALLVDGDRDLAGRARNTDRFTSVKGADERNTAPAITPVSMSGNTMAQRQARVPRLAAASSTLAAASRADGHGANGEAADHHGRVQRQES